MPAEQMTMPASGSAELAIEIEEPEAEQSAAGDPWEPFADLFVEGNSEPGDQQTKERGAEHVAGASQRRHTDRFVPIPALRPRGYNKGQPVCGDGCMKKCDTESRESDCSKNRFVHEAHICIIIGPNSFLEESGILEHGGQTSTSAPKRRRMKDGCDIDEGFGWRLSRSWEKSRLMTVYVQKRWSGRSKSGSFYPDGISMIRFLCFLLAVATLFRAASARAADEEKPYGRVCISIFDSLSGKEEPFKISVTQRQGATVRAHIDASAKCTVLLAALTKEGKLANGWRPQLSELPEEFEEIQLPRAPVTWDWSTPSVLFDWHVCFLASGAKEIEEAKKLVAAMQAPKMEERLLAMQTNKLRELIGRITNQKEKVNQAPLTEPEVGGIFRGSPLDAVFPWRQFAQSINFAEGRPGVLIFSRKNAGESNSTPAP